MASVFLISIECCPGMDGHTPVERFVLSLLSSLVIVIKIRNLNHKMVRLKCIVSLDKQGWEIFSSLAFLEKGKLPCL